MFELEQKIDFVATMDRLKSVRRKALIKSDENRYENSAEHSWHIALAAQLLHQYADNDVDLLRVTQMLLIHDIVEIEAGDTFAFAPDHDLAAQAAKEAQAAANLFGILPVNERNLFLALFEEFETSHTNDAKFAKAIDRILPLIQNMQNDGGSWAQNGISRQQVIDRNSDLKNVSEALWTYVLKQIDTATLKGWLSQD
jgi:putative hydrolases of HD superfamily